MAKKDTINIATLNELASSVSKIGVIKTRELLNTAKSDPVNYVIKLLIADTCKQYCVIRESLFRVSSNGIRVDALCTIVYLMVKNLKLQYNQLYFYLPDLKVNRSRISHYVHYIINLSDKIKCEKDVIDHLEIIEAKMLQNIETSKQN